MVPHRLLAAAAAAAVVVVVGGCAADTPPVSQLPTPPPRAEQAEPPPPAVAETRPGAITDGVWLVGTDVPPGTYRSAGAQPVTVAGLTRPGWCMWSRHSTAYGGTGDDIIASDGSDTGPMIVTVEDGDAVFRTNGCAPWEKIR